MFFAIAAACFYADYATPPCHFLPRRLRHAMLTFIFASSAALRHAAAMFTLSYACPLRCDRYHQHAPRSLRLQMI